MNPHFTPTEIKLSVLEALSAPPVEDFDGRQVRATNIPISNEKAPQLPELLLATLPLACRGFVDGYLGLFHDEQNLTLVLKFRNGRVIYRHLPPPPNGCDGDLIPVNQERVVSSIPKTATGLISHPGLIEEIPLAPENGGLIRGEVIAARIFDPGTSELLMVSLSDKINPKLAQSIIPGADAPPSSLVNERSKVQIVKIGEHFEYEVLGDFSTLAGAQRGIFSTTGRTAAVVSVPARTSVSRVALEAQLHLLECDQTNSWSKQAPIPLPGILACTQLHFSRCGTAVLVAGPQVDYFSSSATTGESRIAVYAKSKQPDNPHSATWVKALDLILAGVILEGFMVSSKKVLLSMHIDGEGSYAKQFEID